MRKKKFLQQKKPSILDLNWHKVQGCKDLNQQENVYLLIYPQRHLEYHTNLGV